jgi:glycosyltransferase involved in cell wall biosynthesis
VFSAKLQPIFEPRNQNRLKLFWFSQTIGKNRGLEEIIQAIGILNNQEVSLTLLGNISEIDKNWFKNLALEQNLSENQLVFLNPIHPDEIFSLASKFDIGLALEQKTPFNRDICLTNKIFTYLIAGLAIVATDTQAQKKFLETYPSIGKYYKSGNGQQLVEILEEYLKNRELLIIHQENAHFLAKNELNWESEAEKFVSLVKNCI